MVAFVAHSTNRLAWESHAEALDGPGDAVGIDLDPVAGAEVGQHLWVGLR